MTESAYQGGYRTFIFDLDGTLLNTLPDLTVLTNNVLREHGFPERSEEEILSYVGNGVRALMLQAVPADTSTDDAERALATWKREFLTFPNELTHPYEGIVDALQQLRDRGCTIGVMSNKFEPGVHQILDQCLPGLIDVKHGEAEDIPRKPDPTGILRTMEELGGVPETTLYVGDSPGDIAGGKNAGVFTIGVEWGYHKPEVLLSADPAPDAMVARPSDLLRFA